MVKESALLILSSITKLENEAKVITGIKTIEKLYEEAAIPEEIEIRLDSIKRKIGYDVSTTARDYLKLDGSTQMHNSLNMGNNTIENIASSRHPLSASTVKQLSALETRIDTKLKQEYISTSGKTKLMCNLNLNEYRITNLRAPAQENDATNKAYVDSKLKSIENESKEIISKNKEIISNLEKSIMTVVRQQNQRTT